MIAIATATGAVGLACGSAMMMRTVAGDVVATAIATTRPVVTVTAAATGSYAASESVKTIKIGGDRSFLSPRSITAEKSGGNRQSARPGAGSLPNLIEQHERCVYAVAHRLSSIADDPEPSFAATKEKSRTAAVATPVMPAVVIVSIAATIIAVFAPVRVIVIAAIAVPSLSLRYRSREDQCGC